MEDLKQRFTDAYQLALKNGLVTSKAEFADFVGLNRQTSSSAFTGKRISDTMVARVEKRVREAIASKNNTINNSGVARDITQKNFDAPELIGTEDLRAIVHDLTQALKEERECHERIMLDMVEKIGKNGPKMGQ